MMGREPVLRGVGLVVSLTYAAAIGWLFIDQPQTVAQATGGLASIVGAYSIDRQAFEDGLRFFRKDQFAEARAAFGRADPAERDARTQFYIAYSYYREGWGHVYDDKTLFANGLARVDKSIAVAPGGRVFVDDPDLGMKSGDELRAELQRGIAPGMSAFNPLRMLRTRK
jgi:glutamine cyclotransferase